MGSLGSLHLYETMAGNASGHVCMLDEQWTNKLANWSAAVCCQLQIVRNDNLAKKIDITQAQGSNEPLSAAV